MSNYLSLINKNHYSVNQNNNGKQCPKELLNTCINYDYFYIPERNEAMFISDEVEKAFFNKPLEVNYADDLLADLNKQYNKLDNYLRLGIKHINQAIKDSNEIYLEHTLYVINVLYGICLCGLSSRFKYIYKVGITNGDILILNLSSISKYGYERFKYNVDNINKYDTYKELKIVPIFLPCMYAEYSVKQSIKNTRVAVNERFCIELTKQICEGLNLKTCDYNYCDYFYDSTMSFSYIPYYEDIAKISVPKNAKTICCYYQCQYLMTKASVPVDINGFVFGYIPSWFVNELNNCKNKDFSFKDMISTSFNPSKPIQIANIGHLERLDLNSM